MKKVDFYKLSLIIIAIIPLLIPAYSLYKQFSPSGVLKISSNFLTEKPFISRLYPGIRTEIKGNILNKIVSLKDNIAYFDVILPRLYKQIEIEIHYQSPNPIAEIGGKLNGEDWSYKTKPLENKIIENCDWAKIENDSLILLQKNKIYNSLEEFFATPPGAEEITEYRYTPINQKFKLDYAPSEESNKINTELRGSYKIYTYIKDESLKYSFEFMEINRKEGEDKISFSLKDNKQKLELDSGEIMDDGVTAASGDYSEVKIMTLEKNDLPEGVYEITINTTDDIITKTISTEQDKVIFGGKLKIARAKEYFPDLMDESGVIYFSGDSLNITTKHEEGLQVVDINNTPQQISQVEEKLIIDSNLLEENGLTEIKYQVGDLEFESDGFYSFSPAMFFYPKIKSLKYNTNIDNFNYIISEKLPSIEKQDGYTVAKAKFNINELFLNEDFALNFILDFPGIRETGQEVKIKKINITLIKEPIDIFNFQEMKNRLHELLNKKLGD